MSSDTDAASIATLAKRVAALEEEVAALGNRIDTLEDSISGREDADGDDDVGVGDQYDRYVLGELPEGKPRSLQTIVELYRQSGVREKDKIKSRIRTLRTAGLLQKKYSDYIYTPFEDGSE